jgi:DNA-binding MarR family transcriptional regulator
MADRAVDDRALDDIAIPALLRGARGTYAQAIRIELAARGFDDLPRNGGFVLGGIARNGAPAVGMIVGLGVTKQAASQLIDTLVTRGYLTRDVDAVDRRRVAVTLTDRGQAAADAVRSGVDAVDGELARLISPAELAGLRAGLAALGDLKDRMASDS